MERLNKQYKPEYPKQPFQGLPFEKIGGTWILNSPIQTRDYVSNKSGLKIDESGKVFSYGGNVFLYDAVVAVDGTGDYTDIQAALNAGKKNLFIRAGTYKVSSAITINYDDVIILGSGTNTVITPLVTDGYNDYLFKINDKRNCKIENLKILGTRTTETGWQGGINIYGQADNCINNCFIQDCHDNGIYLSNSINRARISNCFFTDNTKSIYNASSADCFIYNNFFYHDSGNPIYLTGGYIYINNNYIYGGADYGIYMFKYVHDCIIANNQIFSSGGSCIKVDSSATTAYQYGNLITNNCLFGYDNHTIYLIDAQGFIISNNRIEEAKSASGYDTYDSIYLEGSAINCQYNIISGNLIWGDDKVRNGINESDANQNNNVITNNIVKDVRNSSIIASGANTVVSNNLEI